MRQPIASKLAELRKAIEQIQATPRRGFTKAQRAAVFDLFGGLCACGCEEPLTGEDWHIDHVRPLAEGGTHELANWQPMLAGHHRSKSAAEATARAKAKRIVRRETEGQPPSRFPARPFPLSRGFDKSKRKRMNGQVVARERG